MQVRLGPALAGALLCSLQILDPELSSQTQGALYSPLLPRGCKTHVPTHSPAILTGLRVAHTLCRLGPEGVAKRLLQQGGWLDEAGEATKGGEEWAADMVVSLML